MTRGGKKMSQVLRFQKGWQILQMSAHGSLDSWKVKTCLILKCTAVFFTILKKKMLSHGKRNDTWLRSRLSGFKPNIFAFVSSFQMKFFPPLPMSFPFFLSLLRRQAAMPKAPPFKKRTKLSPTSGPMANSPDSLVHSKVYGLMSMGFCLQEIGFVGSWPRYWPWPLRKNKLGLVPISTKAIEILNAFRALFPCSKHFISDCKETTQCPGKLV